MEFFKCKMCGGELEIKKGSCVAECEYCGTKQTIPKFANDKVSNLFERGNDLRRKNDFDKAKEIYEQILCEDTTDSETYWSLVLCTYGIEYVEEPGTNARIPTVHRAQYSSIFADDNYLSAIKYADDEQKELYEAEAKKIDDIQKGILEISSKEKPFDVFICYKETDENGERTGDSVVATDLYHHLTKEGFKVFFSRITLEGKLGTAYEPYIFAALNSAKVMIVIGSKEEYFNATWVKNEWSRFLKLMKDDKSKHLIPAYKNINPYDLPKEFSYLQAQDMSKIGFLQDLIAGIKKLIKYTPAKSAKSIKAFKSKPTFSLPKLTKENVIIMSAISIIIVAAIIIGIVVIPKKNKVDITMVESAYKTVIDAAYEDEALTHSDYNTMNYFVYDIDDDKMYELIIGTQYGNTCYYTFYRYENNEAVRIDTIQGSCVGLYIPLSGEGIVTFGGRMGWVCADRYTFEGTKMTHESLLDSEMGENDFDVYEVKYCKESIYGCQGTNIDLLSNVLKNGYKKGVELTKNPEAISDESEATPEAEAIPEAEVTVNHPTINSVISSFSEMRRTYYKWYGMGGEEFVNYDHDTLQYDENDYPSYRVSDSIIKTKKDLDELFLKYFDETSYKSFSSNSFVEYFDKNGELYIRFFILGFEETYKDGEIYCEKISDKEFLVTFSIETWCMGEYSSSTKHAIPYKLGDNGEWRFSSIINLSQ